MVPVLNQHGGLVSTVVLCLTGMQTSTPVVKQGLTLSEASKGKWSCAPLAFGGFSEPRKSSMHLHAASARLRMPVLSKKT